MRCYRGRGRSIIRVCVVYFVRGREREAVYG